MRTIEASLDTICPFSAAAEFGARYLRAREESAAASLLVPLAPRPFAVWFHKRVAINVRAGRDDDDPARRHQAVWIDFEGIGPFPFPQFRTHLTFRPNGTGATLRLGGSYRPPLGVAGLVIDGVLGRAVAHRAMEQLLVQIRDAIELQWREEQARFASQSASA